MMWKKQETNCKGGIAVEMSYKRTGRTLTISVSGDIDHHCAQRICADADKNFSISGARNMVIDLSGLGFMDSSGLGIIIGRYKNVTALGGKTALVITNETIKKLVSLSGLNKIIPVYGNVSAALKGM